MNDRTDQDVGHGRKITALLLAAGGGRRLGGRPKALLSHHGRPLVEHAVRTLRDGGCAPDVRVVLGAAADDVRGAADLSGCVLLENPEWEAGMGTSLRAGLDALTGSGTAATLVFLVDQPGVGPQAVARVRAAYRSPATLASAAYGGRRGHPVLLGADHWAGVAAAASGDRGARGYLTRHEEELRLVECGDVADPADIDTPEDLPRLSP
ncbi:nucleotidyltransferase family protein [Streptomyces sp. DSM 42041]|uniref:Nucleotidyltransferase family protein n=1 Tax=Streptomyces hazeniae TaxID=3075538 RepID=A0ABU2NUD7_9ACTN|nr:nucleotidyltransferase family protein [Streptomyces sp. DSM 42041]MDT0380374.1 nucleotidyltransferase family protein [Streptomyces sp. DSM 42041]